MMYCYECCLETNDRQGEHEQIEYRRIVALDTLPNKNYTLLVTTNVAHTRLYFYLSVATYLLKDFVYLFMGA